MMRGKGVLVLPGLTGGATVCRRLCRPAGDGPNFGRKKCGLRVRLVLPGLTVKGDSAK
jgi:hypothetical protein